MSPNSTIGPLPHVAFVVDNLDVALKGKEVLITRTARAKP